MVTQPVPEVTEDDIKRIVIRDFGESHADYALSLIAECGSSARVRLAVLKLANGDNKKLSEAKELAIQDYRDVLSEAEYPRYSREIGFNLVPEPEELLIINDDWKQYCEWLEREPR